MASTARLGAGSLLDHDELDDVAAQIFLSGDLLPSIIATLDMKDYAAASVCTVWREAWTTTNEFRRGLRHAELPAFDFDINRGVIVANPAGDLFSQRYRDTITIADASCRTVYTGQSSSVPWHCIATMGRLYEAKQIANDADRHWSIRSSAIADGLAAATEHAHKEIRHNQLTLLTPAPNAGLLFAVGYPDGVDVDDEIIAFDAHTLQLRGRFGKGFFAGMVSGLAVVGDELYVVERHNGCLQIFALTGEHLRTIARGDWRQPEQLLHCGGRLYLRERAGEDEEHNDDDEESDGEETWSEDRRSAGRRIFVLTPQAKTLQVWKTPGDELVKNMYLLGRRLLVQVRSRAGPKLVLKGL